MFVGATGIGRVVQRTVELMKEHDTDDVAPLRRHRRRHAAALPQLPLQRVARPVRRRDVDQRRQLLRRRAEGPLPGGAARRRPPAARRHPRRARRRRRRHRRRARAPALAALNETLRDDYVADCQKGVDRWNRTLAEVGPRAARCPTSASTARVGDFRATTSPRTVGSSTTPSGRPASPWLPTDDDRAHVESLMVGVTEPGKMAGWVAPPATGIHDKPVDFDYVSVSDATSTARGHR